MIPASEGRPGLMDLDLGAFWALYERAAPPLVRLGFRAAVWLLTLLPMVFGHFRPFTSLGTAQRDAFLVSAAASSFYLVRQLVVTVKMFAAFAYFQDAGVRKLFERDAGTA